MGALASLSYILPALLPSYDGPGQGGGGEEVQWRADQRDRARMCRLGVIPGGGGRVERKRLSDWLAGGSVVGVGDLSPREGNQLKAGQHIAAAWCITRAVGIGGIVARWMGG